MGETVFPPCSFPWGQTMIRVWLMPRLLSSLLAQTVKCLSAVWETWVWSLGWEKSLEEEMATHSRTLAWKVPWMGEPGRLQSKGSQRVRQDWATSLSLRASLIAQLVKNPPAMQETLVQFLGQTFGFQNHCRWWLQPWNQKMLAPWKKSYEQPKWHIKKQRLYFSNKDPSSQSYGFSSSHVWMWELDYKESWAPKNWCFWTVVLKKTLESLLDCKEVKPVNPKSNQSCIFIGRTDAETETLILWPSDVKTSHHWKRPWCWEWL